MRDGLNDRTDPLREMAEVELKSMLKSSIHFKSLGGLRSPELTLSEEDLRWWRDARFGMFIHWGLYSILGRGEWVMHNEHIPREEYGKLADVFRPRHFDAAEWAGIAKNAGMKYMVLTARHHDGFSLWDSPASYRGFTSVRTGAKRDFVKEYVAACRGADLGVGLYYSLMDWRFPGYFRPRELTQSALEMKAQTHAQLEELVSRYGKIDIIWYDGAWLAHQGHDPDAAWLWDPLTLNAMVRRHNPATLINPRSGWEGDFQCDEGSHRITGGIIPVPWEKNMCIGSGRSWGWIPNDPVMSFADLITMMVDVFTRDGNLLLNVGPDKDGVIPAPAVERLDQVGAWMKKNGRSVYATRGGPFQPVDGVYGSTYRGASVYLHVLRPEELERTGLPGISSRILSCALLDGPAVTFRQTEGSIRIRIPPELRNPVNTIVEMTLDSPIEEPKRERITLTA